MAAPAGQPSAILRGCLSAGPCPLSAGGSLPCKDFVKRVSIPLCGGKKANCEIFHNGIFWGQNVGEVIVFITTSYFYVAIYPAVWNLSHKSDNVFSRPEIAFHFEILRKGIFKILSLFHFPKMKLRTNSHNLMKPPDFTRCIFPVACSPGSLWWTYFTYQDFPIKINVMKWQYFLKTASIYCFGNHHFQPSVTLSVGFFPMAALQLD